MRNRKLLLATAAIWAAYNGLTSVYLAAFALALGASNTVIGILAAIPWVANILTQIPGSHLVEYIPRKKIVVIFDFIGRSFWIPILFAPFYFYRPLFFVAMFYSLSKLCETIPGPSFNSLLADCVPVNRRGDFVSKRQQFFSLFGMVSMVLGGLWLKQFPKESPTGFVIMFTVGALIGIIGAIIPHYIREPKYKDHEHHTLKEFFTLTGTFRHYVIFTVIFYFGFMLASPLVTVFMLKTLNMSYAFYGVAFAIPTISKILFAPFFGKLTDKYGDKPIAIFGHLGTAGVTLLLLLVTPARIWLIIPVMVYSGFVWAAAEIAHYNLLLDLTDARKRAMQVAEFNIYASVPMIIGPILGGWMTEHVTIILAGIPLVFVLSSIIRALSVCFLIRIPEPRAKKEYPLMYIFRHAVHFHPSKGLNHTVHVVKRVATGMFQK